MSKAVTKTTQERLGEVSAKVVWHPTVLERVPEMEDQRSIVRFISDRVEPQTTPQFQICAPNDFFWIKCDCSLEAGTGALVVSLTPASTYSPSFDLDGFCSWFFEKHGRNPDLSSEGFDRQVDIWRKETEENG